MLFSIGAVTATPAAASFWNCPDGSSCYYEHEYGGGRMWRAPSCGFFNLGDPNVVNPVFNDRITSINNAGNGDIDLYNWEGRWVHLGTVKKGYWVGRLDGGTNDKVDAIQIAC
ncbi:peptidase inhibitor family I36 protein [Couchioplanes azureus]|uniref:peptidase inhibitor family I36 protein n=1 Tax=Couchioplanes caeruleus TaxID=56438 RepID=UPI00167076EA|nr:peptidase inhibitor family I36 protein [Couchioplanes caeruleus]